jgi:ornithine carbamoyltransferase
MKKVFLAVSDYSSEDIQMLPDLAVKLKKIRTEGENRPLLEGKPWP